MADRWQYGTLVCVVLLPALSAPVPSASRMAVFLVSGGTTSLLAVLQDVDADSDWPGPYVAAMDIVGAEGWIVWGQGVWRGNLSSAWITTALADVPGPEGKGFTGFTSYALRRPLP